MIFNIGIRPCKLVSQLANYDALLREHTLVVNVRVIMATTVGTNFNRTKHQWKSHDRLSSMEKHDLCLFSKHVKTIIRIFLAC